MPRATRFSTASGVPDHLAAVPGVGGVADVSAHVRVPDQSQHGSSYPMGAGGLPLDPLLSHAGAYWDEDRHLVRAIKLHAGPPRLIEGRWRQPMRTIVRHVAPPGMSLEDARHRALDFYSPELGWIRAGLKREQEYPENLGQSDLDLEFIDVDDGDEASLTAQHAAVVAEEI